MIKPKGVDEGVDEDARLETSQPKTMSASAAAGTRDVEFQRGTRNRLHKGR